MEEPSYEKILQGKIDYYGETKAAYHFAANEYARQYHSWALKSAKINDLNHHVINAAMTIQSVPTVSPEIINEECGRIIDSVREFTRNVTKYGNE